MRCAARLSGRRRVAPLPDVPLAVPLPFGVTLAGGDRGTRRQHRGPAPARRVEIGGAPSARRAAVHVRAVFAGWRGGIVPAPAEVAPAPAPVMALAPMLAAALAVNEAFLYVSGTSVSRDAVSWDCRSGILGPPVTGLGQ